MTGRPQEPPVPTTSADPEPEDAAFSGLNAPVRDPAPQGRVVAAVPTPRSAKVPTGLDGPDIRAEAASHLDYLSKLAKELGVVDPVAAYFDPIVGRWNEMHREAELWRTAAKAASHVSQELGKPLGNLDAGWEGKDADAFVAYIGSVGVAGTDAEEALNSLAKALDDTASALRQIALDVVDLLMDTAEVTSESASLPVGGEDRARSQLSEAKHATRLLYESARHVLEAFVRVCDGVEDGDTATPGIEMAHHYPQEKFQLSPENGGPSAAPTSLAAPDETAPATAAGTAADDRKGADTGQPIDTGNQTAAVAPLDAASGAPSGGTPAGSTNDAPMAGGMGMMPMGMGMGGGQGGDREHKVKPRVPAEPTELFGKPDQVVPPVLGKD
jgi:uncharacterized protein YukE